MGTKRKQKGYSFNPLDHSFFGGDLEFNPSGALSGWEKDLKEKRELKVIEGLLAKEKKKAQNKKLGILEHDEGGEYTDEENKILLKIATKGEGDSTDFETVRAKPEFGGDEVWDNDYYAGQLASEELDQYKSYSDPENTTLEMLAEENQTKRLEDQYAQYRTPDNSVDTSMISTDSSKSKMSPAMKQYAVGLLKDFMTPAQDDPPQQVRGAGISRGGGTPFPSLLQPKPKSPRYTPKGLV